MRWKAIGLGAVAGVLLGCGAALGDGVYIPPSAYPKLPEIPAQSAIVLYRHGEETLILESAFRTGAPEVAWVLPVPAEPTKVEQAEAGMVRSAAFALRPVLEHHMSGWWKLALLLLVVTAPFCLNAIFTRAAPDRDRNVKALLGVGLLLTCVISILLPSLGTAGGTLAQAVDGVREVATHRLGDGEFTVVRVEGPAALSAWLEGKGMRPLDAAAVPVVEGYIKEGWCFVVGKLAAEGTGVRVPRPLAVTFPAKGAVFPMRLTALAGSTTRVELVVVAEGQAAARYFGCVAADRFVPVPPFGGGHDPEREGPLYIGDETQLIVGSPDLVERLWPGCVVTKLEGTLRPEDMVADVGLEFGALRAMQARVFSPQGLGQVSVAVGLAMAAGMLVYAAVLWRGRQVPGRRAVVIYRRVGLGCLLVVPSLWLLVPTVEVRESSRRWLRGGMYRQMMVAEDLGKTGRLRKGMTNAEVAALPGLLEEEGGVDVTNVCTGERMRRERSPGNFDVREIGGKVYFCVYDETGRELRQRIEMTPGG